MGRPRLDPAANWWSKVERREPDECWPWKAGRDKDGYGKFTVGLGGKRQRHTRAHRFGYELLVGSVPADLVVRHTCDNPPCCNPAHWRLGTPRDNNDDKVSRGRHAKVWGRPLSNARRTHCQRGHALTPENTRIITSRGRPTRRCKACEPINARLYYHRQKAQT